MSDEGIALALTLAVTAVAETIAVRMAHRSGRGRFGPDVVAGGSAERRLAIYGPYTLIALAAGLSVKAAVYFGWAPWLEPVTATFAIPLLAASAHHLKAFWDLWRGAETVERD
jgi:hypothetical protein